MTNWEVERREQRCAEVIFGRWVRGNTPPLQQENRRVGWGASELMTLISTESLFVRIQLSVWPGAFWFKSDPYPADVARYILVVSLPLVSYTLHAAAAVRGWETAATHGSMSATQSWGWTTDIVQCTLLLRFVCTCGIFHVITRTFWLQPRCKIQLSFLATPQGMLWPHDARPRVLWHADSMGDTGTFHCPNLWAAQLFLNCLQYIFPLGKLKICWKKSIVLGQIFIYKEAARGSNHQCQLHMLVNGGCEEGVLPTEI